MNLILEEKGRDLFYTFSNADGKSWIVPRCHMRTAMNLYQPSGMKGKMMKGLFPYLHPVSLLRNKLQVTAGYYQLSLPVKIVLDRIFGGDKIEFALFCGTPCVHQKITIQLSRGNRILGYCKVSDNPEIISLFYREAELLFTLKEKGVSSIPVPLYCGEILPGVVMFVQSTVKTNRSTVVHQWTGLHEQFLQIFHNATKQILFFEESDYFQTLCELKKHADWLPVEANQKMVLQIVDQVINRYIHEKMEFSAYHADFTPWNMFMEGGKFFVFDFEYSRMSYPPFLDRYHFFTQTAIFEKHWDADRLWKCFRNGAVDRWDKETYVLYLLDIISRFAVREKGNINGDVAASFTIWLKFLNYLIQ